MKLSSEMQAEFEDILEKVLRAEERFMEADKELLTSDANERSITHKLAEHLQSEFPEWNVDCEYNRNKLDPKRLPIKKPDAADDTDIVTVYPDIIVHRRGFKQNLLVIEAKKVNSRDSDFDIAKLKAFTGDPEYEYRFGLLLMLDTSQSKIKNDTWFTNGQPLEASANGS